MATRKYIKNKPKSRRRKGNRKTKQRGGCTDGQCMTGGRGIAKSVSATGPSPK